MRISQRTKSLQYDTGTPNRFVVIMVCKHDKVIPHLPPLVKQNINAGAPLNFKWRLDTMISE